MGSAAIAAWVAHIAFWTLIAYGWAVRELTIRSVAILMGFWVAGCVGLPYVPYEPARAMFSSFVAVLDIALVFAIFKGDVRLN